MWKSNETDHHSQGLAANRMRPVVTSHAAVRRFAQRAARVHIQPKAMSSAATTPMSWSQSRVRLRGPTQ